MNSHQRRKERRARARRRPIFDGAELFLVPPGGAIASPVSADLLDAIKRALSDMRSIRTVHEEVLIVPPTSSPSWPAAVEGYRILGFDLVADATGIRLRRLRESLGLDDAEEGRFDAYHTTRTEGRW